MKCQQDHGLPEVLGGIYFHVIHGAVDMTMIVVIITFNSLITAAILRYNRKRKTKGSIHPSNSASLRLVLSMAMSDILVGFTNIYYLSFDYSCAVYTSLGAQQTPCVLRYAVFTFTSATSTFSMVLLAIDRYIAVVHALRYRDIMTIRRANLLILLVWILGCINGFCLLLWNNWSPKSPCVDFMIVPFNYIAVVCTTNSIIILIIVFFLHWGVHMRALASTNLARSMGAGGAQVPRELPVKTKSACTIVLVMGAIVTLWTPLIVVVIIRSKEVGSPYLDLAYRISLSVYNMSYFVNTFVYSWKNATIRAAILDTCGVITRRKDLQYNARSERRSADRSVSMSTVSTTETKTVSLSSESSECRTS